VDAKEKDSMTAAMPLMGVLAGLKQAGAEVRNSSLSAGVRSDLLARWKRKANRPETALNEALNVTLEAVVVSRVGPDGEPVKEAVKKEADAVTTVSPGQEFLVAVDFNNGSKGPLSIEGLKLEVPAGWGTISDKTKRVAVKSGDNLRVVFRLKVPKDAAYTRPYWHRDDPETESVNHIDDEKYATLPFPLPVLRARVEYRLQAGEQRSSGRARKEWHCGDGW